jgi:hypothetical protein
MLSDLGMLSTKQLEMKTETRYLLIPHESKSCATKFIPANPFLKEYILR